jgi:hypothetical protein
VILKEAPLTNLGRITVKIYLFCPETGLYQGEDFADDTSMKNERQGLPDGATTIAPPLYRPGQVAVFSISEKRWELKPVVVKK